MTRALVRALLRPWPCLLSADACKAGILNGSVRRACRANASGGRVKCARNVMWGKDRCQQATPSSALYQKNIRKSITTVPKLVS